MDMAAVRRDAIDVGWGRTGPIPGGCPGRAAAIAAVVSLPVAICGLRRRLDLSLTVFSRPRRRLGGVRAFQAAALALPFVALCQVYLGGTRGLKIMRSHAVRVLGGAAASRGSRSCSSEWAVVRRPSAMRRVRLCRIVDPLRRSAPGTLGNASHRSKPAHARGAARDPRRSSGTARRGRRRRCCPQLLFWTDYFVLAARCGGTDRTRSSACTRRRFASPRPWCCS